MLCVHAMAAWWWAQIRARCSSHWSRRCPPDGVLMSSPFAYLASCATSSRVEEVVEALFGHPSLVVTLPSVRLQRCSLRLGGAARIEARTAQESTAARLRRCAQRARPGSRPAAHSYGPQGISAALRLLAKPRVDVFLAVANVSTDPYPGRPLLAAAPDSQRRLRYAEERAELAWAEQRGPPTLGFIPDLGI
jgi:hypothetical protein